MARPSAADVQAAYDLIDAYQRAIHHLGAAYKEAESEPEHIAENDCDGDHPLDAISDAMAALSGHIDALRGWLGQHDREAA